RCRAEGVKAYTRNHEDEDGTIHMVPYRAKNKENDNRICTAEYEPVYGNIGGHFIVKKLIIHNIGRIGNNVNAEDLHFPTTPCPLGEFCI
ncbi:MAG: hypothetical protein HQK53_17420, partial [Oligoflexia bacterium]|nr:hypothetical protein [Oligoflexia bacterium]